MRTIFISPILWKKLDRAALRRGEEGQALVLIALVAVGIVAMVGLSVDGGIAYLSATQLQRAADSAALAGVQWIPNNRLVADARASLSAEASGVRVACYYDSGQAANTPYNQRCHRANTTDELNTSGSSQDLYYMQTSTPAGTGIRYSVTLVKKQQRLFLGVLGFGEFTISRTSTAQFSQLVRFGASFNYFGSNGVLNDHYMRCGASDLANCAGTGTDLIMRGATYQKYVVMRCNQTNPPAGVCVGGFWGHIAGQDLIHSSGDAYTPVRDGGNNPSGSCGISGNSCISTNQGNSSNCLMGSDPSTWFVNEIIPTGGTCDPKNSNNNPVQNFDTHPDAPGGTKGFGYEIGVEVNANAIWSFDQTSKNLANHTNLNITVFDAAMNDQGSNEQAVGDNYQNIGANAYGNYPANGFNNRNDTNPATATWFSKLWVCKGNLSANCTTRYAGNQINDGSTGSGNIPNNGYRLFPDQNNLPLTYNDMRTRFTLYPPPPNDSIPATYNNVVGTQIASFEASDVSIRKTDSQYAWPIKDSADQSNFYSSYCYFVFDDQKAYWNNTRDNNGNQARRIYDPTSPTSPSGSGPDFASLTNSTQRYSFVCPGYTNPNGTVGANADYRWNVLQGTPTARYGSFFNADRTVESGILRPDITYNTDISSSPVVTNIWSTVLSYKLANNTTVTQTVTKANTDPQQAGVPSIWSPTITNAATGVIKYTQVLDPGQNCRQSAVDTDGWPVDPYWGHNRLPFNAAFGDPLVNRAWVTDTTQLSQAKANPVARGALAGYYTLEYGFHGWRCDWDFDSNYTLNPLQDPTQPHSATNPSLSEKENSIGVYNIAFAEGHPGLTSNSWMASLLNGKDNASNAEVCRDLIPENSFTYQTYCVNVTNWSNTAFGDKEFGLEPYFHLSNVAWSGGNLVANPVSTTRVVAGTYMVHVQTFGGSGANRYSLKAEYENPVIYSPLNLDNGLYNGRLTPVPNVYAMTAMSLYANNRNNGQPDQNIVFDLANIPPANAGTQAILELWDAGDVNGTLSIEVRKPSGWGPRIDTNNSSNPAQWQVPWPTSDGAFNDPIPTRLTVCPYTINPSAANISASCVADSSGAQQPAWQANGNYNDEWMLMSFTLLSPGDYSTLKTLCATHNVPEALCYYYQVNYHLTGANSTANDTTTWQLVVQVQPIHLVE